MAQTRLSDSDLARLQRLAEKSGQNQQEVLRRALDTYERDCFLDEVNAAYAKLRANPEAWAEELAERSEWDAASLPLDEDS